MDEMVSYETRAKFDDLRAENTRLKDLAYKQADDIEQLQGTKARLRAALQTIVGMCLAPDRKGNGIGGMHAIACRALEHPDWNSYELGTDEQSEDASPKLIHVGLDGQPHDGPRSDCPRCNYGTPSSAEIPAAPARS